MPRPKRHSSEDGILTPSQVAAILSMNTTTVRKYCDDNRIPNTFLVHSSRERRIPAPSVAIYCERNNIPKPKALTAFLKAYHDRYGSPDYTL